jgi:crotonobetainyl-CoA:carnitine CoA-transferase CaiB-like acyl-CoA transferase
MLELSDTHGIAGTFCELGEHTEALLCELGYSVDHIETLIAEQVVAAHRPALVSEQPA